MSTVVHDPEYIGWVKRSLNRLVFAGLRSDGTVTPLYREWVKEFQKRTSCSTGDGSVDRVTQDYIIAINNVSTNTSSRTYIQWVQESLQLAGFGNGFAADGQINNATKNAIQKFQASAKHKHVDGVVGPRTERDLWKRVPSLTIPGYYPGGMKPDPVQQREDDWLKNTRDPRSLDQLLESWINLMIREIAEGESDILDNDSRRIVDGMLKMFRTGVYNYKYSDRFWYLPAQTVQDIAGNKLKGMPKEHSKNALEELRATINNFPSSASSSERYSSFKKSVVAKYYSIDNGLRQIWYQIGNNSGVDEGPFALLKYWHEDAFNRKDCIISLYPTPVANQWSPF